MLTLPVLTPMLLFLSVLFLLFITGTMEFYDGTTLLGSSSLNNGSASLDKNNLSPGSHSITAKYVDALLGVTTSSPLTQFVNPALSPGIN